VEGTEAVNFPVQAGGAHLLNTALLALKDLLDHQRNEHILVPVHDEIVVEGPDPARLAKLLDLTMAKRLEYNGNWMRFSVDCSVGNNWAECHAELDPYCEAGQWWFWSKGFEKLAGPYETKKLAKEATK
jgi:DNA polymerase I-like protein with 3'-5' exonuclease and polymerase domains